jgi:hypothetical protein
MSARGEVDPPSPAGGELGDTTHLPDNGLQRKHQHTDLAQLGITSQRGPKFTGQHHRVRFINRAVGLDLARVRVDEEGNVLPTRRVHHTTPRITPAVRR